jgi:hypothetical protein
MFCRENIFKALQDGGFPSGYAALTAWRDGANHPPNHHQGGIDTAVIGAGDFSLAAPINFSAEIAAGRRITENGRPMAPDCSL